MTKPTTWLCTQRRLRSAWSSAQSDQSSLCGQWVAKDPSFLHADREDSDQTGRMPRLIWVFAGCTCHFVGFVMRRLILLSEMEHHKTYKITCICAVWSESLLGALWVSASQEPKLLHIYCTDVQAGLSLRCVFMWFCRLCCARTFLLNDLWLFPKLSVPPQARHCQNTFTHLVYFFVSLFINFNSCNCLLYISHYHVQVLVISLKF